MSNSISTDDILIEGDKYTWTKACEMSLDSFLGKYRPSMVQDDGTKPWIWVRGSDAARKDTNMAEACEEALSLLKGVTEKVQAIQNDASIPTRSNKKTGTKNKKELREEVQSEATLKLKEIAVRHGYLSGKWLIFAPHEKVDLIWSSIATSLVSGPLSSTVAHVAKVATTPKHETPNYQHVICVYVPDVFDKEAVIEVMKTLLRHHGATLAGVKSDLYTVIGIDSKHPSGISSTVWKNTALLNDTKIKELREEYFSSLTTKKAPAAPTTATTSEGNGATTLEEPTRTTEKSSKAKPKPKLKKKTKDDPFASDEDIQEGEEIQRKEMLKGRKVTSNVKRTKSAEDDGEEDTDEPKLKKTRVARK